MKFKLFIKTVNVIVEIVLALVVLIMFTAFALKPLDIYLLTNSLITIMIITQLYVVNVLINIYEKLEKAKR